MTEQHIRLEVFSIFLARMGGDQRLRSVLDSALRDPLVEIPLAGQRRENNELPRISDIETCDYCGTWLSIVGSLNPGPPHTSDDCRDALVRKNTELQALVDAHAAFSVYLRGDGVIWCPCCRSRRVMAMDKGHFRTILCGDCGELISEAKA